jgi:hypothetical protein
MKLHKPKKRSRGSVDGTSPTRHLTMELEALRRDLRTTLRAYAAGLEVHLAETAAAIAAAPRPEELSRERQHEIRDLTILVRNRKLKPEKGRRKDLRKIDELIGELHSATRPAPPR